MSCRTDRSEAGFSLIEVLVAIAVLAVVLAAVGAEVGTTVKGIRSVDQRLPLLETAQSLLASLPQRNALQPGTQTGGAGAYRWRIDVVALAVTTPRTATLATTTSSAAAETTPKWAPLAITVRVQGSDGGPPVRLDTVRLVPTGQGRQNVQQLGQSQ
jgi:general secretion pathway protein I